jgi:hypothetical protein
MSHRLLGRWVFVALVAVVAMTLARSQPAATSAGGSTRAASPIPVPVTAPGLPSSAGETREDLQELLRRYPPDLARVLKLDPGLMANEAYMASYPVLSAFLAQHPEVMRSPDYFLESVWIPAERGPESVAVQLWQTMMDYCLGFLVFGVVTTFLVWLIKTLLEQRRWARLSKIQTDVHSKLLDRIGSNEDLIAYMQSSPGKRFLEAAPIAVDAAPSRGVSAPVSRILWSIQAGVVLAALGIGLQVVRGYVPPVVAPPLLVMGAFALSIGIGFVVSAIVSYALSRRLGLFETPVSPLDRGAAGSSPA